MSASESVRVIASILAIGVFGAALILTPVYVYQYSIFQKLVIFLSTMDFSPIDSSSHIPSMTSFVPFITLIFILLAKLSTVKVNYFDYYGPIFIGYLSTVFASVFYYRNTLQSAFISVYILTTLLYVVLLTINGEQSRNKAFPVIAMMTVLLGFLVFAPITAFVMVPLMATYSALVVLDGFVGF